MGVRLVPRLPAKSKIIAVLRSWSVAGELLRLGVSRRAERVHFHEYALQRHGRGLAAVVTAATPSEVVVVRRGRARLGLSSAAGVRRRPGGRR
jgi:hypothetical protein